MAAWESLSPAEAKRWHELGQETAALAQLREEWPDWVLSRSGRTFTGRRRGSDETVHAPSPAGLEERLRKATGVA